MRHSAKTLQNPWARRQRRDLLLLIGLVMSLAGTTTVFVHVLLRLS